MVSIDQSNVAITDFGPSMTTLHVVALPVVLHSPPQPANVLPLVGFAVSTTVLPSAKLGTWQFTEFGPVPPQFTPGGLLVTSPLPGTGWHCKNVHEDTCDPKPIVTCNWGWNVAVTAESAFMATVHAALPEHAPLQPVKLKLALGAAFNVTLVPTGKLLEHVVPQLIPPGVLVIVPPT
jgi:hypothetical protein